MATIDKTGTTVTNGVLIEAFVVAANSSEVIDLTKLRTELLPDETFVIAAMSVSGTATKYYSRFNMERREVNNRLVKKIYI